MRGLFAFSAICIMLASCAKDLDPITGYDSKIEINNITLAGIGLGASVTGYLTREYKIASDSLPVTESYIDSFFVTGDGYDQEFHFNTPPKTITCKVQVKFKITGSAATAASVESFRYYKDKEIIFAKTPLEFSGAEQNFHSAIYTIDF